MGRFCQISEYSTEQREKVQGAFISVYLMNDVFI